MEKKKGKPGKKDRRASALQHSVLFNTLPRPTPFSPPVAVFRMRRCVVISDEIKLSLLSRRQLLKIKKKKKDSFLIKYKISVLCEIKRNDIDLKNDYVQLYSVPFVHISFSIYFPVFFVNELDILFFFFLRSYYI